ncbi:transposase [Gemmata sp. JC717]|uniref:transposase n=1 Tax=Gemmata algarum TaxID=2975278 RepID=UPI0021BA78C3|nr:transposase [Gemmata algarum]MDY3557327.1 transposase [Gemmata algarum]
MARRDRRADRPPAGHRVQPARPPADRAKSGRPHRVNEVSVLINARRVRFSVFAAHFTADVLTGFLGRLLGNTPGPVFLTLEGYPVQPSRWVRAAARADMLRLLFLPPYCPELNPTEYLNNAVKHTLP